MQKCENEKTFQETLYKTGPLCYNDCNLGAFFVAGVWALLTSLFAAERKKKLPFYPSVIGIVTSPEAAALRDALRTLALKAPWVKVILYPTSVQGEAAERGLTALQL